MINYQHITTLFGTPLNAVPKPNVPFKLNGWHILLGIVCLVVVSKGISKLEEDLKDRFSN
jgi:hypothetical protein